MALPFLDDIENNNLYIYLKIIIDNLYIMPVFEDLDDCMVQGEAAGEQAYGRDQNPYPQGTTRHEWWDAGWSKSLDELVGR